MEKIDPDKVKEKYKDISQEDVERKFGQAAKDHRDIARNTLDAEENQRNSEWADECDQIYAVLKKV